MAGKNAGYGRTLGDTSQTVINTLTENLSDDQIPVWDDTASRLENSGLVLDPLTQSIRTTLNFRTTGVIESGTSTFNLGSAHSISSTGENVAFTNRVTNQTFHPTWQPAGIDGDWSSVQRTPTGSLVENHPFQNDDTATVTNPLYDFVSLAFNHRLYRVTFSPNTTQTNVVAVLFRQVGMEFIEYSRTVPFDITGGSNFTRDLNPFIDIEGGQNFRLMVSSPDGDVVLNGDATGNPFLLLDYWAWEDRPLATVQSLGNYRFDDTVEIDADLTITTSNLDQYNRKIWLLTGTSQVDITISDDLDLFYFGLHLVNTGTVLIGNAGGGSTLRIDQESDKRYTTQFAGVFFRAAPNNYRLLSTANEPVTDTFVQGASFSANVLTLDRNRLGDITATLPAATTSAAGAMAATDKTKLDGIADNAEVNVQADWDETSTVSDAYIQNKPNIPTIPTIPDEFTDLTDTPASLGTAGQLVAVNGGASALEFINAPTAGAGTFLALTDTPASYTAEQFLRVNAAGDGVEQVAAPTAQNLGNFRFDNTVEITSDITITSANVDTYNLKIWLITGGSHTVTINEGAGLTFYGVYVRVLTATGTLRPQASTNVRINNTTGDTVLDGRQSATYFQITADRYQEVYNNFRPENFVDLGDTPTSLGTAGQIVAVNPGATGLAFIDPTTGGGVSTFLALTDTPAAFTAGQLLRVNGGGTAIEFGGTVGTASTDWGHATLPGGRLPSNSRQWYTYTGTGNATRQMPLESGISSGWHCFIGNDSTTGTITLQGDFRGSLASISLLPQQGCEISYNGSIFLEGPAREIITVSSFPEWSGNPLRHDTSYTGFSANSNGLNIDATGSMAALNALLNRNVRVSTRTDNDFLFDLPVLNSGNFGIIPIGSGFGVHANGPQETDIRARSNDFITRGGLTHNFSNPLSLFPGANVTLVRTGTDSWNVTVQSGTITGGT